MQIRLNNILSLLPKIDVNSLKVGQRLPVEVVSAGAGKSALIRLGGQEIEVQMDTTVRPGDRFWVAVRELGDNKGLVLSRSQNISSDLNIAPQQMLSILSRGLPLDTEIATLLDRFQNNPQQLMSVLRNVLETVQNPVLKEALTQLLRAVPQWENVSTQGLVNFLKNLGVQHESQLFGRMIEQNNTQANAQMEKGASQAHSPQPQSLFQSQSQMQGSQTQTQPQTQPQPQPQVLAQAPQQTLPPQGSSHASSQDGSGQGHMQGQGAAPGNPQGLNPSSGQPQGGQALNQASVSSQGQTVTQNPISGQGQALNQNSVSTPALGQGQTLGQGQAVGQGPAQAQVLSQSDPTGSMTPMNPTANPQQTGQSGAPPGAVPGNSAGAAPGSQPGPSPDALGGHFPEASAGAKAFMGAETNQQGTGRHAMSVQGQHLERGGDLSGLQMARAFQDSDTLKAKLIRLLEATGQNLETNERGIAKALLDDITAQQLWLQSGIRKNAFVLMNMLLQDQDGLYQARIAVESARKGSRMDPRHCRIAVQVDTYHLGTVGADVWLYEDRIHLCLLSDDPEGMTEVIQSELPFAQEHFRALGMALASITTKDFADMPRFRSFLAGEQVEVNVEG